MKINGINNSEIKYCLKNKVKQQLNGNSNIMNYSNNTILHSYPFNFYLNKIPSFKGNNDIVGYDKEKERIEELLINPVNKNSDNIPSGIVLYSEDSKVGSNFIETVADRIQAKVVTLEPKTDYLDSEVYHCLEKIQDDYFNTGKRTILVIKNSELSLSKSKENEFNVSEMCNYILDVASKIPDKKYISDPFGSNEYSAATTIILETDNPSKLSPEILKKVSGIVALPVRTQENTAKLLKSELEKNRLSDKDILSDNEINYLVQKLGADTKRGAYSDGKFSKMVKNASTEYGYDKRNFMEILSAEADKTKRDISPREVKKSNETIKWLTTNNYIDELKTAEALLKRIDAVLAEKNEVYAKNRKNKELSEKFEENESLISSLSDLKKEDLKDIKVGDVPVLDFWLSFDMSVENAERIKQNNRLKELWFDSVINDKEKSEMLISVTLDKLQNENELIKSVRNAYKDIIENDKTITEKQKEILSNQQESILFFKVISHKLTPKDMLKMEVNVLNTIDQVGIERETILNNAKENIFKPVADQTALTSDNAEDIENTEYITTLLVSAKQSVNYNHKREIDIALKEFIQAKLSGDNDLLNKSWKDSVVLAFEYFETEVLDDITNKNIELLNSINEKVSEKDSSKIKNLTSDKNLSIEQREFIARYKNDKNFRTMLNNPNIDINTIIEDLVFFESSNKNLISQYKISDDKLNINKVMSDKFKQINDENKDIKVQTDRLLEKMGEIKSSVDNFSDNFNFYSKDMLNIQTNEFQQFVMANDYLSSIANNTEVIKRYSCAITRTKLVELGKDKYYKDIISEITDLLPDDEQLSLKDFMAKVEELAKHEKNIKRRNAIIKAGIAVTATAALATGAYYFGPSVISHMASKLPAAQAGLAVNETIKTTNIAKKLGNSHLISFMARDISQIQIEINRVETEIENCKRSIAQYPAKSYYGQRLQTLYKKLENLQKELQDALSKNK